MSFSATVPHAAFEIAHKHSNEAPLLVSASLRIEADTQRVLYALAIPEYMEAWLQMPGMERIECHPCQRSFDRFRITAFSCGCRTGSINASCILSKPYYITYVWESNSQSTRARTRIDIRLRGDRTGCDLKLVHRGFCDRKELEWYSLIWDRSLSNLRQLMEGVVIHAGDERDACESLAGRADRYQISPSRASGRTLQRPDDGSMSFWS